MGTIDGSTPTAGCGRIEAWPHLTAKPNGYWTVTIGARGAADGQFALNTQGCPQHLMPVRLSQVYLVCLLIVSKQGASGALFLIEPASLSPDSPCLSLPGRKGRGGTVRAGVGAGKGASFLSWSPDPPSSIMVSKPSTGVVCLLNEEQGPCPTTN